MGRKIDRKNKGCMPCGKGRREPVWVDVGKRRKACMKVYKLQKMARNIKGECKHVGRRKHRREDEKEDIQTTCMSCLFHLSKHVFSPIAPVIKSGMNTH